VARPLPDGIIPGRNGPALARGAGDGSGDGWRKRSEDYFRFLAEASVALGEITDVDNTLDRITKLAVPAFADWCEVTLKEPSGALRSVTVNHWNPDKVRQAEELFRQYPIEESTGLMRVIATGQPIFTPDLDDKMLQEAARDARHLELIRALGIRSHICVPLLWKSRIKGAINFATSESERRYDSLDLQVAEELARRAAIAIENAELLQALKEADRRKDEFIAVLAHELRNPLAPVRNAVEILRASAPASPQLQWTHDVIERQVRQMSRLVDDLLDVSRISMGKFELRRERVEIAAAVRIALEGSRPLIERGGHDLTVRMPPEPIYLDADLARLAQVISNLLNNAAKYTQPGGHIWLSISRRDGHLVIRVGDNGTGIPREMLGRIFDMYAQGGGDHSQGGLGIGLTLVRRLVELHGGTVEARSEGPGKGSEFIVCLPLAGAGATESSARECAANEEHARAGRKILVVDDNRDAADSLSMLLGSRGHEVRVAYDGLEAVGSAIAFNPDVVLMDIGLPKLYGYDAARRIREARGKDVLLVAITGWGQDEDRRKSREAGFDHHLTKPVDPEAITRLIQ
jgi:signal transduction histidine kinase